MAYKDERELSYTAKEQAVGTQTVAEKLYKPYYQPRNFAPMQVQAEAGQDWEEIAKTTGTEVGDLVKANPLDTDVKAGAVYNVPPQQVSPYPLGNLYGPPKPPQPGVPGMITQEWLDQQDMSKWEKFLASLGIKEDVQEATQFGKDVLTSGGDVGGGAQNIIYDAMQNFYDLFSPDEYKQSGGGSANIQPPTTQQPLSAVTGSQGYQQPYQKTPGVWNTLQKGADFWANSLLEGSYLTERYANKAMYDLSHGKDEPPYEASDFKTYEQWLGRKAELWTSPAEWDKRMAEQARSAQTGVPPSRPSVGLERQELSKLPLPQKPSAFEAVNWLTGAGLTGTALLSAGHQLRLDRPEYWDATGGREDVIEGMEKFLLAEFPDGNGWIDWDAAEAQDPYVFDTLARLGYTGMPEYGFGEDYGGEASYGGYSYPLPSYGGSGYNRPYQGRERQAPASLGLVSWSGM